MKQPWALIVFLFAALYLLPLGARPLMAPDETRYVEVPREMIATGDWVVPRLAGLRYFEKPVAGYWATAAALLFFGENRFAVRLPVALAALISALLVLLLMTKFGGGKTAALAAGVSFLTSAGVYATGTFSTLDGLVSVFLTATMACFYLAYRTEIGAWQKLLLSLAGAFAGLAFLTKGFLAFAVIAVAIMPFLLWERRWRAIFEMAWVPALAALAVSLPWGVAIHLQEPDYWRYFFWVEHIQRFMNAEAAEHQAPFWFFLPVTLAALLPWSILIPCAAMGGKRLLPKDSFLRYLVCWVVFPFLFFSLSRGKLPTYILPCIPPMVMLLTLGLINYLKEKSKAFIISANIFSGALAFSALALLLIHSSGLFPSRLYTAADGYKPWLASGVVLIWSVLVGLAARQPSWHRQLFFFSAAPLLFFMTIHPLLPQAAVLRKAPVHYLETVAVHLEPGAILVADSGTASALSWYYKQSQIYLFDEGAGELRYGLKFPDSRKYHLDTVDRLSELLQQAKVEERQVLLFLRTKKWTPSQDRLPPPAQFHDDGRYILVQY